MGSRLSLAVALLGGAAIAAPVDEPAASRLRGVQAEIDRLSSEVEQLRGREHGVLGEMERLGAELSLRDAELRAVTLRLEDLNQQIEGLNVDLAGLAGAQAERRHYLAFRLREQYRAGPDQALRRLLGGAGVARYLGGLGYATYLSERDARVLQAFRDAAARMADEQERLSESEIELGALRDALHAARANVEQARSQRARLLATIRQDQSKRREAIQELRAAAEELTRLVGTLAPRAETARLDVRKFRGLLDWPSAGRLGAGFGSVIHPRFKTRVPHPGLDIESPAGSPIQSVFDGVVLFASWMRGYGLTAIVDHGGGVLSVYAHASVLLVEAGQSVGRGQRLGLVGETGSLRGPFLYFELRVDGQPIDPSGWLRAR